MPRVWRTVGPPLGVSSAGPEQGPCLRKTQGKPQTRPAHHVALSLHPSARRDPANLHVHPALRDRQGSRGGRAVPRGEGDTRQVGCNDEEGLTLGGEDFLGEGGWGCTLNGQQGSSKSGQ